MKIVLIADDSPVIRKVGRRLLEDIGYVVMEASSGTDAIEQCRLNMPDVVIIDRDMPGPSAVDTIAQIARMPVNKPATILFCLSEVKIPEVMKAKRAGAAGFLLKPFDSDVLKEKFAEYGIDVPSEEAA